jgi:hypothetical protein
MSLLDRLLVPLSPAAALRRAVRLTEQGNIKQAFPLLTRAALAGIAEAEYRVGRCYLEGAGVPPSRTEGARWLERAANQGYVEAQAQLATLAIHGLTASADNGPGTRLFAPTEATEPDFETSLRWARKAAAGGSADGEAVLGYILTSGPEAMRDPDEAHRCYERSAARRALSALPCRWRARRPRRNSRPRWRRTCARRRMPGCRRHSICLA